VVVKKVRNFFRKCRIIILTAFFGVGYNSKIGFKLVFQEVEVHMRLRAAVLFVLAVFLFSACAKDRLAERQARYRNEAERQRFAQEHNLNRLPLSDIPIEINDRVIAWMGYFQGAGRNHIQRYMERSGRYTKMMRDILKENGLPQDLVYVAMIESGFNNNAYSRSHAVGPWQFIRGTGSRYGLEISRFVDERRDPIKSTWAAAHYLKDLYNEFGDWYLAMAAYNAGEGRIRDAVDGTGFRNFWDIVEGGQRYLRAETRDYVPKFIAATIIAKMPQNFGFSSIDYQKPLDFDVATVETQTDLEAVAQCAGVSTDVVADLNPHLVRGTTPPRVRDFAINLPKGTSQAFKTNYAALPKGERIKVVYHKVKRGETAASIAKRYGISKSALLAANDLSLRHHRLRAGSMLAIPHGGAAVYVDDDADDSTDGGGRIKKVVTYRVQKGDTVSRIAGRYGVSVAQIKSWNSITQKNPLRSGRVLNIYQQVVAKAEPKKGKKTAMADEDRLATKRSDGGSKHSIQAGESLWSIAQRYKMTVDELAAINGLSLNEKIKPGQRIIVTMTQGRTALVAKNTGVSEAKEADAVDGQETKVAEDEQTSDEGDTKMAVRNNESVTIAMASASEASPDDIILETKGVSSETGEQSTKGRADKSILWKDGSQKKRADNTKANPAEKVSKKYTMKKGDSLIAVAKKHGISVSDLMKWNQIKNPKTVRAGQVLKIQSDEAKNQKAEVRNQRPEAGEQKLGAKSQKPEAESKKSEARSQRRETETSSDSLVVLNEEEKIGVSRDSAAAPKNNIKKEAGKPLKLADIPSPASRSSLNYRVKDGDTLWDIARRHKVTIVEIQKWNNLSDPSAVKPGDNLTIRK